MFVFHFYKVRLIAVILPLAEKEYLNTSNAFFDYNCDSISIFNMGEIKPLFALNLKKGAAGPQQRRPNVLSGANAFEKLRQALMAHSMLWRIMMGAFYALRQNKPPK